MRVVCIGSRVLSLRRGQQVIAYRNEPRTREEWRARNLSSLHWFAQGPEAVELRSDIELATKLNHSEPYHQVSTCGMTNCN